MHIPTFDGGTNRFSQSAHHCWSAASRLYFLVCHISFEGSNGFIKVRVVIGMQMSSYPSSRVWRLSVQRHWSQIVGALQKRCTSPPSHPWWTINFLIWSVKHWISCIQVQNEVACQLGCALTMYYSRKVLATWPSIHSTAPTLYQTTTTIHCITPLSLLSDYIYIYHILYNPLSLLSDYIYIYTTLNSLCLLSNYIYICTTLYSPHLLSDYIYIYHPLYSLRLLSDDIYIYHTLHSLRILSDDIYHTLYSLHLPSEWYTWYFDIPVNSSH